MHPPLEINGLTMHIEGAGPTLVFLHGWPDGPAVWDETVAALKDRYRCVRFSLPGFDLSKPPRPVSMDAMCVLLAEVVDTVSPDAPVTMVIHDWGCFFGYEYIARNPDRVARVVSADIGDTNSGAYQGKLKVKEKLSIAGYQLWLAVAWKLGAFVPSVATRMTRFMAKTMGCRTPAQGIGWQMNYPYAMQWFGSYGGLRGVARIHRVLGENLPVMFVYGKRKPFMFHSTEWLEALHKTPGCAAFGLEAGHWMMKQKPGPFNAAVGAWLDQGSPNKVVHVNSPASTAP